MVRGARRFPVKWLNGEAPDLPSGRTKASSVWYIRTGKPGIWETGTNRRLRREIRRLYRDSDKHKTFYYNDFCPESYDEPADVVALGPRFVPVSLMAPPWRGTGSTCSASRAWSSPSSTGSASRSTTSSRSTSSPRSTRRGASRRPAVASVALADGHALAGHRGHSARPAACRGRCRLAPRPWRRRTVAREPGHPIMS
jgi:hypothetical protein